VDALEVTALVNRELTLFAATGFLIGGVGDLVIDMIWILRTLWRRLAIYSRYPRHHAKMLPAPGGAPIAVFVPAWDEPGVIGPMLRRAVDALGEGPWHLFVGTYPNDPATTVAARAVVDPRITVVVGAVPGPTTKGHCLNSLWQAMRAHETGGTRFRGVLQHDAEDVVHRDELRVVAAMLDRFDLVQLPVRPLPDPQSRWIAGHYLDEFAESHAKTMVVREAIGAAIPAAGVGCAFGRQMLDRIATLENDRPFADDSLTEDYEMGLRVGRLGGRAAFVRMRSAPGGDLVAVRAFFPATIDAAVRQKARWMIGIALAGWDRLGWDGGGIEWWMRLHDRQGPFAALILFVAYLAFLLNLVLIGVSAIGISVMIQPSTPLLAAMLLTCLALLCWRLVVRAAFVSLADGWREGLRSIPRMLLGNCIAILAARRAVRLYIDGRGRRPGWDKTVHHFPDTAARV